MQTISIFGNVTKDVVTRTGKNKQEYTAFTVATNPEEGKTVFLKCFAWGGQSRFANKLSKGERVQIIGQRTDRTTTEGGVVAFVRTQYIKSFPKTAAKAA